MSNRAANALRYWGPAILWGMAISIFSTRAFSGNNTSRFIVPLLQWLFPDASWPTILGLHDAIRKAAHFVEYFILSLLVFRGFRGAGKGWQLAWSFWTVALVVGYSALDEVHQAFVPGRTGAVQDVLIDSLGTVLAQVLLWAHYRRQ